MCLQGGQRGDDPEITLTAFVAIALAEAKQTGIRCDDSSANLQVIHTGQKKEKLFVSSSYNSSLAGSQTVWLS